ncbi:MAG: hypothetical protein ACK47B_02885 [Armatimonadota bacterium]
MFPEQPPVRSEPADNPREEALRLVEEAQRRLPRSIGNVLDGTAFLDGHPISEREYHRAVRAAIRDYSRAIELDPQCLEAYLRRALLYKRIAGERWLDRLTVNLLFRRRAEDFPEHQLAVADARKVLALEPADCGVYLTISQLLSGEERVDALRKGLSRAGGSRAYRGLLQGELPLALMFDGQVRSAIREWRILLRESFSGVFHAEQLALCYSALEMHPETEAAFRLALGIFRHSGESNWLLLLPTPEEVASNLAEGILRCRLRRGDWDGLRARLQLCAQYLLPGRDSGYRALLSARSGERVDDLPGVLRHLRLRAKADPHPRFLAGLLLESLGRHRESRRHYRSYLRELTRHEEERWYPWERTHATRRLVEPEPG